MATDEALRDLEESLKPLVVDAIARGEDLSTPEHMQRFVERVLEQQGYVFRGGRWIRPSN